MFISIKPCKYFLLAMLFLTLSTSLHAEEYKTPHQFQPGDVISSEVFNEIYDEIRLSKKLLASSDLIGCWTCTSVAQGQVVDQAVPGWTTHPDGLYIYLENAEITFIDDGDSTYSLSTSSPNPFNAKDSNALTTEFDVFQGLLWYNEQSFQGKYIIRPISSTRFVFSSTYNILVAGPMSVVCDKKELPPSPPTDLSTTFSDLNIKLTWTDNSENETGFKIVRRDSLMGNWDEIVNVNSDVTSYIDNVPKSGTYWYRVKATNSFGDSIACKVVKVVVTN